jgi:hypothetical protein
MGPAVFHMPLPLGVDFSSGDTILTLDINQSPQHFEYVLTQEPMDIVVDPETWVIQKNTVTQGIAEYVIQNVLIQNINSIGRTIELKLTRPALIRIFDITGRKVYEMHAQEVKYQPSNAGIYHVIVGNKKNRVVVVK